MKAIIKNFDAIPNELIDETRKAAFQENISAGKYVCDNKHYKVVFTALRKIYHDKCAYCEKSLGDADKPIEHYRPKKGKSPYYWLALSWDNLLLACTQCNRAKLDRFQIEGKNAIYNSQDLAGVQNIIKVLDAEEKPLIVNPEQEEQAFFDENLTFNIEAQEIASNNQRLKHTIEEACDLNREELKKLRFSILKRVENEIIDIKATFLENGQNRNLLLDLLTQLKKREIDKVKNHASFTAWRTAIIREIAQIFLKTST